MLDRTSPIIVPEAAIERRKKEAMKNMTFLFRKYSA